MQHDFAHIDTWIFDLDNTLYPPSARLFDQISVRMTEYVMDVVKVDWHEANRLRDQYWVEHGTTLAGLMTLHNMPPEPFLTDVHNIDLSHLEEDQELGDMIVALPGRKIIHTNGSEFHATRVAKARGILGAFDAIYGVEHTGYVPKPHREAFDLLYAHADIDPKKSAFFEDEHRNLHVPKRLGTRTVYVGPFADEHYIDTQFDEIKSALRHIQNAASP